MIIKLSKAAMKYERLDTLMYLACETEIKAVDLWLSHFADELIALVRIFEVEDNDSLGMLAPFHQRFTDLLASKADQYHKICASFSQNAGTLSNVGDQGLLQSKASSERFENARRVLAGFLVLIKDVVKRQRFDQRGRYETLLDDLTFLSVCTVEQFVDTVAKSKKV